MSSITITFGDRAENHKGMQLLGTPATRGYSITELEAAQQKFEDKGYKTNMVDLNTYIDIEAPQAKVLVVKRGADCLLDNTAANGKDLYEELAGL